MQPTREQAWEWLKEYTKSEALRRHADMLSAWRGQAVAVRELRKHIAWYLHGLRGSAQVRAELLTLTDPRQVDARLEQYISSLQRADARPGPA